MLDARPTLYLLVGLPGAGKTTRSRVLEVEQRALRFSPDEWMIPLYGDSDSDGMRDVLEGRLIATALRVMELGASVILDFGFWGRDERSALRWLADAQGAACVIIYLPVGEAVQRQRVEERFGSTPEETFALSGDDLDQYRGLFQVPDQAELAGTRLDPPPQGSPSWAAWANVRWPSLNADK
ncbi:MAG TPA: ATP-binding protein [Microlunatus sp.]